MTPSEVIFLLMILPLIADDKKAEISDSLRTAAKRAGCENPVVEIFQEPKKDVFLIKVKCR